MIDCKQRGQSRHADGGMMQSGTTNDALLNKEHESLPRWNASGGVCVLLSDAAAQFPQLRDRQSNSAIGYIQDRSFLKPAAIDRFHEHSAVRTVETPQDSSAESLLGFPPNPAPKRLLDRDEERELFWRLHFCRFQAACLQAALRDCRGHAGMRNDANKWLDRADAIRNEVVEVNLRLVRSIARRYAGGKLVLCDDLISTGNTALIKAAEYFDYRRGFRFSTYAYQAIQRSIFAVLRTESRCRERFIPNGDEITFQCTKDAADADRRELYAAEAKVIATRCMDALNDREREIVKARFGLEEGTVPSSFQQIGRVIGVSKQRAATIFSVAMHKLEKAIKTAS